MSAHRRLSRLGSPLASFAIAALLALTPVAGCSSAHSGSAPTSTSANAPPPAPLAHHDDALPELPPDPREKTLAEAAAVLLSEQHVLKKKIDDTLSREAFPKFIEQLDSAKLLLLQSHISSLSLYADQMDDELEAHDLVLARKGAALIAERRKLVASMVADILSKPFDFKADEEIETDPEKREFCKTDDELRARWTAVLKLQVLERLQQMDDLLASKDKKDGEPLDAAAQKVKDKALAAIPATYEAREEKARKELATRFETRFIRLDKSEPLEPAEVFINAINAAYDPHTQYLAPSEKANFDIAISGTLQGIGAVLGEQDHYIAVQELVPGGASWQQGKLEAGDLILAVAQEGQEPVDVTDMPIDKVVEMIRGKKGTVVTLTVKKPEGQIEIIPITRDVIKVEATFARGAILNHDKAKGAEPVGYVYLPGFYGEIGQKPQPGERNATDDVRALLVAMQKKNVKNVIIDLRGNGGGLLAHARDISGLFFDTGPVVQTRDSDGEIEVLADKDPSVAFSGNVVVMVDRFSASAAEILSGALQDYERAVVVGTTTHGKGTVQAVIDLDRLKAAQGGDPLGIFKITTQQYFRVSGGSTQLKGVVPDIALPDPASFVESGERTLFHPIPWTTIQPAPFKTWKHEWSLPDLQAKSKERASKNALFSKVLAYDDLVASKRKKTRDSVQMDKWKKEHDADKAALDAADPKLTKQPPLFDVTPIGEQPAPPPSDHSDPERDKAIKKKLDAWKEDLSRDPWVEESMNVLKDMSTKR